LLQDSLSDLQFWQLICINGKKKDIPNKMLMLAVNSNLWVKYQFFPLPIQEGDSNEII